MLLRQALPQSSACTSLECGNDSVVFQHEKHNVDPRVDGLSRVSIGFKVGFKSFQDFLVVWLR